MELFMFGDPRYLAGAETVIANSRNCYESRPRGHKGPGKSTADILKALAPTGVTARISAETLVGESGQSIHSGKGAYHQTPAYNNFLVDGQWPTAGVELETVCRRCTDEHAEALVEDLKSNWFHFERDGSLDPQHGGTYGYELITEPLPPRAYRDPRLWTGLQNLLSPWLESFDHEDTGLHVHVGLEQFAGFDAIPLKEAASRLAVGKAMCALAYYCIADQALIDRVALRRNTHYCAPVANRQMFEGASRLANGTMNGYEFIDLAVSKLASQDAGTWRRCAESVECAVNSGSGSVKAGFCQGVLSGTTSHGTEVNTEHRYTIEFRRGKGTCNALSIHRMVELMTLVVRYACRCCRRPEDPVSTRDFYRFVHDSTTSEVLRRMVGEARP